MKTQRKSCTTIVFLRIWLFGNENVIEQNFQMNFECKSVSQNGSLRFRARLKFSNIYRWCFQVHSKVCTPLGRNRTNLVIFTFKNISCNSIIWNASKMVREGSLQNCMQVVKQRINMTFAKHCLSYLTQRKSHIVLARS